MSSRHQQSFDSLRPGSSRCRINFLQMLTELSAATSGVLVRIKARVAATSTSAADKCVGSVNANMSSETQPMEETPEVTISEPISDDVNVIKIRDQPMLNVELATKDWELSQETVKVEAKE